MQEIKSARLPMKLYIGDELVESQRVSYINDCYDGDSDEYTFLGCYTHSGEFIPAEQIDFCIVSMAEGYEDESRTPSELEETLGYHLALQTLKDQG